MMSTCQNLEAVAEKIFDYVSSRHSDKIEVDALAQLLLTATKSPGYGLENPKADADALWKYIREFHGAGEALVDAGARLQLQLSNNLDEWGLIADRIACSLAQPYVAGSVVDDNCIRTTATWHEIAEVLEDNPWLVFLIILEPVLWVSCDPK